MPLLPPDQARVMGALASVGLSFVLAVVIGITAGLWLDGKLGTSPWFFFLFLCLGFGAGVVNLYRATRRL
jgi:ATP synthase protein I